MKRFFFFAALVTFVTLISCNEPQYVASNSNGEMMSLPSEIHQKSVYKHWRKDSSIKWIVLTVNGDTTQIWKRGQ